MLEHPAEYPWSSYRANAQGELSALVTPHALFLQLGADASTRVHAYRELFRYELDLGLVDAIRVETNGNFALGDTQYYAFWRPNMDSIMLIRVDDTLRECPMIWRP